MRDPGTEDRRRWSVGRGCGRLGLMLALALLGAPRSAADMGGLLAAGQGGPFELSAVVAPWPPAVGPANWSFLVRDTRTGQARTDLRVTFETGPGSEESAAPGRSVPGAHPGFYSARVQLGETGQWWGRVRAEAPDGSSGSLRFVYAVEPGPGPWLDHWGAILFPFMALLVFAWHQRRRLAQGGGGRASEISGDGPDEA